MKHLLLYCGKKSHGIDSTRLRAALSLAKIERFTAEHGALTVMGKFRGEFQQLSVYNIKRFGVIKCRFTQKLFMRISIIKCCFMQAKERYECWMMR
jgi:ribosomal protein L18E